jgi:F-type H+-transporting ATPase subunit b
MIEFVTKFAQETEASGFEALGFDLKAFLIQLVTFLIVFYILKKYVFGRIVELLEKRRKTIEEGVKLSAEIKAERERLEQEIAQAHRKAREEADKLLAATQSQADNIIKEAEQKADLKAENMIAEGKKKIVDETERAKRALERETVGLVIRATEIIAKEKLDSKKDSRLIAKALEGQS